MRISKQIVIGCMAAALLTTAACGDAGEDESYATSDERWNSSEELVIGAIPDQEPQELQRLYDRVADYLSEEHGVDVSYLPVTDYNTSVSLFRLGDLDLVWYGGLTGVQARLQVDGAEAIVQRDIDEDLHSVFIANPSTGLLVDAISAFSRQAFR